MDMGMDIFSRFMIFTIVIAISITYGNLLICAYRIDLNYVKLINCFLLHRSLDVRRDILSYRSICPGYQRVHIHADVDVYRNRPFLRHYLSVPA